jgi:RNase P subunit RPR2
MPNEKRLIDANALLAEYDRVHIGEPGKARKLIEDAPTVDAVEVVHARWVHCNKKSNRWYCSNCGEKILYNPRRRTYNIEKRPVHEVKRYCRGCGAKLDGERREGE